MLPPTKRPISVLCVLGVLALALAAVLGLRSQAHNKVVATFHIAQPDEFKAGESLQSNPPSKERIDRSGTIVDGQYCGFFTAIDPPKSLAYMQVEARFSPTPINTPAPVVYELPVSPTAEIQNGSSASSTAAEGLASLKADPMTLEHRLHIAHGQLIGISDSTTGCTTMGSS